VNQPSPNEDKRRFFTPQSLARYLGVSERTMRQMLSDGVIPSYKIVGRRRIDPPDVDAYLAGVRQQTRRPAA
jgi:excisionase family DNA binding protein